MFRLPASRSFVLCCLLALAAIAASVPTALGAGISPALRAADASRDRSDRNLISDARAQRACVRAHPKRCHARRKALQQAGRSLARAERRFAHKSVVSERRSTLQSRQQAPAIRREDGQLTWTKVADVNTYLVIRKAPGMTSHYSVVKSTTVDPPVIPGEAITYRVRTAIHGSAWSSPTTVSYSPTPRKDPESAPIASLDGATLKWTKVGAVKNYVVVRKIAGNADVYSAVQGTSLQLTEVPGATAAYSVRTAVTDSAWSPEVAITYPDTAAPAPQTAPATATSSVAGFQVGMVMRTWEQNDTTAWNVLKPKSGTPVRFEVDAANPASGDKWVNFYAGLGATPQPMANFSGVPSDAQIDALAAWAKSKASKIKLIELGNEDSYTYKYGDGPQDGSYQARARAYGAAAKRLGQGLAGSGVGVLAQGEDAGTNTSVWVDQMYAAAPDLHKWVAGWILHPYGLEYMSRLNRMLAQVGAHGGAGLKVYCTELGVASDNGRTLSDNYGWSKSMTYQQAGDTLRKVVGDLKASGKVAEVMLYQSTDQQASGVSTGREYYFGLVQKDGQPKGALTQAATELLNQ